MPSRAGENKDNRRQKRQAFDLQNAMFLSAPTHADENEDNRIQKREAFDLQNVMLQFLYTIWPMAMGIGPWPWPLAMGHLVSVLHFRIAQGLFKKVFLGSSGPRGISPKQFSESVLKFSSRVLKGISCRRSS